MIELRRLSYFIDDFNITYAGALHSSSRNVTIAFENSGMLCMNQMFLEFSGSVRIPVILMIIKEMGRLLRSFGRVSYDMPDSHKKKQPGKCYY
jgi:hypothetical protein